MTHTELGQAVALSDLANERGMTVEGVAEFPAILAAAGLPHPLPPGVMRRATKLNRDEVDATMWRCCRPLAERAPAYTHAEAQSRVADAEAADERRRAAEREEAARREQRRARANPTMRDLKADLARAEVDEATPEAEEA